MTFYGLHRDFQHAGYFPTVHHEHLFAALKTAVQQGQLVGLSGIVGCGKTTLLRRSQDDLRRGVEEAGETLSWVLAGHPKLKNDLSRGTMEEIGSRSTFCVLEGVKGQQRPYLSWLLETCSALPEAEILAEEAAALLATRLVTPLPMIQYLPVALEAAYKIDQKPVSAEMIDRVLAQAINGLASTLTRHGYSCKVVADLGHVRPAEIRSFLQGRLSASRAQELRQELLAAGIPLSALGETRTAGIFLFILATAAAFGWSTDIPEKAQPV